jgi:tetratricopeptide (TPR) repeat protein
VLAAALIGLPGPAPAGGQPDPTPTQRERLAEAARLGKEANKLRDDGKTTEAIEVWQKRVAILRELLGPTHDEVLADLELIAGMQEAEAAYPAARRTWTELARLRAQVHGEGHWKTAEARWALADIERLDRLGADQLRELATAGRLARDGSKAFGAGKLSEAADLNRRALAGRRKVLGDGARDSVRSLEYLGITLHSAGDVAAARPVYEEALKLRRQAVGDGHPDTARNHRDVATALDALGHRDGARRHYELALATFRKQLGEADVETAVTRVSLATSLLAAGDYTSARPLLEADLRVNRKVRGERDPKTVASRERLGLALALVGNFPAAREQYEQVLAARRGLHGEDDPASAAAWSDLGGFHHGVGDYPAARGCYEKALAILTGRHGPDHPDTLAAREQLAGLLGAQGELKAAREGLEAAVAGRDRSTAPGLVPVAARARARDSLGLLLLRMGAPDEAASHLRTALELTERVYGPDHPRAGRTAHNLALARAALGAWEEAAAGADRGRRLARRHGGRTLLGLAEAEQLDFLRFDQERAFAQALSLARARPTDAKLVEQSAAWVLNGKAVAVEALGERAARGGGGEADRLRQDLARARTELAGLALRPVPAGQEADHRRLMAAALEREQDLARKVGQAVGRPDRADPWVDLADVRQALSAGAVLIELARFDEWDVRPVAGAPPWKAARYAAWVIPAAGRGDVRLVDLGEAEPLDEAVWAARAAVQAGARTPAPDREAGASHDLRRALDRLSARLLRPLVDHIEAADEWVVSPDGDLWLVPWALLPLPDGRYAVEAHRIRHLASGRDLARPRRTECPPARSPRTTARVRPPSWSPRSASAPTTGCSSPPARKRRPPGSPASPAPASPSSST